MTALARRLQAHNYDLVFLHSSDSSQPGLSLELFRTPLEPLVTVSLSPSAVETTITAIGTKSSFSKVLVVTLRESFNTNDHFKAGG